MSKKDKLIERLLKKPKILLLMKWSLCYHISDTNKNKVELVQ